MNNKTARPVAKRGGKDSAAIRYDIQSNHISREPSVHTDRQLFFLLIFITSILKHIKLGQGDRAVIGNQIKSRQCTLILLVRDRMQG
jgi:hypothetical protein